MRSGILRGFFSAVALVSVSQFAQADDASAAKEIASILEGLNHFPSAAQKETLMAIGNDGANSAAIQAIAKAVHDMQHSVSAEAKTQLATISADSGVSAEVRALAEITAGITHMPSADAKARLQAML